MVLFAGQLSVIIAAPNAASAPAGLGSKVNKQSSMVKFAGHSIVGITLS